MGWLLQREDDGTEEAGWQEGGVGGEELEAAYGLAAL